MLSRNICAFLVLLMLSAATIAAPLQPNSGLWWEEPVTGRFYAVEIAPSGRAFVVISEFDENGKPRWTSMRGEIEVSSEAEQRAGGVIARFSAPLLDLNGACPTCPVSGPEVRPHPDGQATIVFTSHATAEFQQGAIRRPLRYFAPADQPEDFPANRLAGRYLAWVRSASQTITGVLTLEPARSAACTSYVGAPSPEGALRLAAVCQGGICLGDALGLLAQNLEIHVGSGQQPEIRAYRRGLGGNLVGPSCVVYFGTVSYCTCPPGTTPTGQQLTPGSGGCVGPGNANVCTETHRIAEQAGRITGLPLLSTESELLLTPQPR